MKLKTLFVIASILLICQFNLIVVVHAQSTTFTISRGIYPQATYTIWREGTTYYAKNRYGVIPSWGRQTNAIWVINNASLNGLTSGRSWQESILLIGQITIDAPILLNGYTKLYIEGNVTLANNSDCNMIENNTPASQDWYIDIVGGTLRGNKDNQASGHGIFFNCTQRWKIQNLRIISCKEDAIRLTAYGSGTGQGNGAGEVTNCYLFENDGCGIFSMTYSADHTFSLNEIGGNKGEGISLSSGANSNEVTNNKIWNNGLQSPPKHAIYLYNSDGNIIGENRIDYNGGHGLALAYGSTGNVIDANVIYCNSYQTGYHTTYDGMRITDSNNNTITSNRSFDSVGIYQNWGIQETGTSDWNLIVGDSCLNNNSGGIKVSGANTECHSCFNGTTWVT